MSIIYQLKAHDGTWNDVSYETYSVSTANAAEKRAAALLVPQLSDTNKDAARWRWFRDTYVWLPAGRMTDALRASMGRVVPAIEVQMIKLDREEHLDAIADAGIATQGRRGT